MQEKPVQHYRVTLEQAKRDYQDGLLTATGLVYYAIAILRPPRQKLRVRHDFPEELGIKKRTFYRSLSRLKIQNQIEWEPTEALNVWTTPNEGVVSISDFRGEQSEVTPTTCSLHALGQIDPLQGQIDPLQGQIDPLQGQIDPLSGSVWQNRGSEPALCKGSESSPDITYKYKYFLSNITDVERENFLIFAKRKVSELPSKPVLPERWIETHHAEIWRQYKCTDEGKRKPIEQPAPNLEQVAKLQEFLDMGKIKNFYPQRYQNSESIVVDTGSTLLWWWEFFESANLEA